MIRNTAPFYMGGGTESKLDLQKFATVNNPYYDYNIDEDYTVTSNIKKLILVDDINTYNIKLGVTGNSIGYCRGDLGELVSEDLSLGSSMERFTIDFTNQSRNGIDTGYYPIDNYKYFTEFAVTLTNMRYYTSVIPYKYIDYNKELITMTIADTLNITVPVFSTKFNAYYSWCGIDVKSDIGNLVINGHYYGDDEYTKYRNYAISLCEIVKQYYDSGEAISIKISIKVPEDDIV